MKNNLYSIAHKKVTLIKEFIAEYSDICRQSSTRIVKEANRLIYNINTIEKRHNQYKCEYAEELKYEFTRSIFDRDYISEIKNRCIDNIPEEPRDGYIKGIKLVNDINTDVINIVISLDKLYHRAEKYKDKLLKIYNDPNMVASIESLFNKIR